MAIRTMTREEYKAKFGKDPVLPQRSTSILTPRPKVPLTNKIANFFGAKGITEQFGSSLARAKAKPLGTASKEQIQNQVGNPSLKEVVGSAIQTGANFLPVAGKGAGFLAKTAIGAGTGAAFDLGSQLQDPNKGVGDVRPGVGTAVGAALPAAGAVTRAGGRIVGRLFKGLGSGLSGVSTETIDKIIQNPRIAQKATEKLKQTGNRGVLEENARKVLGGVSKIKNEASQQYKKGLEKLKDVDINAEDLKNTLSQALSKNKVNVADDGILDFSGAEFLDSKIQRRAEEVINKINQQKDLSGTGVRKLIDIVDNSRFKSSPDGDRQAFNALMGDLKNALKEGVNLSTDKLGKINKKYSSDVQLAEAVEGIFGKVNYRNLNEVTKAARKLDALFSQKGIDPDVVDDFLERVGVSPEEFRTTEAVRQISAKSSQSNTKGLSIGEMAQQTTSAVVTPKMVKEIATKTGLVEQKLKPILEQMKPEARNVLIQTLLPEQSGKVGRATTPLVTNLSIKTGLTKEQLVPFLNSLRPAARNALIQSLIQEQ